MPNAEKIFNVVFFVVLTSVLVQGTTIPLVARRLGLEAGPQSAPTSVSFDAVISGDSHHQLHEVRVEDGAPAAGALVVELGLPRQMLILLVRRAGTTLMPEGSTVLKAGDELLVFAERSSLTEVEPLFTAPNDPGRTSILGDET